MIGRPATEEEKVIIKQMSSCVGEHLARLTKELGEMKAGDCMVYDVPDPSISGVSLSIRIITACLRGLFNVVETPGKVFVIRIKEG